MIPMTIYSKEIINFLRTVTIKCDLLKDAITKNLLIKGIDVSDELVHPYYLNLNGDYHHSNEEMYIRSADTGEQILFSKETLASHPKTAAIYKIPNPEYDELCATYPEQVDLIKSIVYPPRNLNEVLNAPSMSLLSYDDSLLQINERDSLVNATVQFVDYIRNRWYIPEFAFEDLYPITFWAIVWSTLTHHLFTQRILNLKTSRTHELFIWETLTSKGLSDYRDVLTMEQSLWLYRNINYILANRGSAHNLEELAKNLLDKLYVSLEGKTLQQQTYTNADKCFWYTEVLSENISSKQSKNYDRFETIEQLNYRMYMADVEKDHDIEHIKQVEDTTASTSNNVLTSKFLEIKKQPIDTRYSDTLNMFLLDTLVYRVSCGEIKYKVQLTDPFTGTILSLPVQDALLFMYYASMRSRQFDPVYLPEEYTCHIAYKHKQDIATDKWMHNGHHKHLVDSHITSSELLENLPGDTTSFETQAAFIDQVADQFLYMIDHIRGVRGTSDALYSQAMATFYDGALVRETINLNWSNDLDYPQWFSNQTDCTYVKDAYDKSNNPELFYEALASSIAEALLPLTDPRFEQFIDVDQFTDERYTKLKDLFVQLCSYNVAFLDTSRDRYTYMFTAPTLLHRGASTSESSQYMHLTNENVDLFSESEVSLYTDVDYMDATDVHGSQISAYTTDLQPDLELNSVSDTVVDLPTRCYSSVTENKTSKVNIHMGISFSAQGE